MLQCYLGIWLSDFRYGERDCHASQAHLHIRMSTWLHHDCQRESGFPSFNMEPWSLYNISKLQQFYRDSQCSLRGHCHKLAKKTLSEHLHDLHDLEVLRLLFKKCYISQGAIHQNIVCRMDTGVVTVDTEAGQMLSATNKFACSESQTRFHAQIWGSGSLACVLVVLSECWKRKFLFKLILTR